MTESTQIVAVTNKSEMRLADRQLVDYHDHRERYIEWLLTFGKNPDRVEGYAKSTAQNHAFRTDRFNRWIWEQAGGYTHELTHDHGDRWLTEIASEDCSDAHRAKVYQSLFVLYEWLEEVRGPEPWDPVISFYDRNSTTQPRDFLSREERTAGRVTLKSAEFGT